MSDIQDSSFVAVQLLAAGAKADTSAATSAWVAISQYTGTLLFVSNVGTVTAGQVAGKIRHADNDSGSNAADVTGATFTAVTTSNDPKSQVIAVQSDGLKPYVAYVGTVTTGPVDMGVTMLAYDQYA